MSLSENGKNKKLSSNIKTMGNSVENIKKTNKLTFTRSFIGMVLFVMAVLLTVCSLYMVAMTAFERATTKGEAGIIALVAACVALSAHLLPALVKGRKSIKLHSMIAFIWIVCVAATLYSHTLFFVTTQNEKADVRSENSPEIKNIETLIAQKKEWINEQKVRSISNINVDITNEKIKIEQILPKVCETCKTNKAKLNSYEIRKTAFEEEKLIAEKVEEEKNKIREMQEEIINKKEEKRTDAVFEKMAKIIPGMSYESFNLSSAVTNALLLEILATLFWWLLFPSQKGYKIEGKPGQNSVIKRREEDDGFIVDGEISQRTVVKGELVADETLFLENYDPKKINNQNRIAFAKEAYNKDSKNLKYVLYDNEVYPVVSEDLFVSKIVLSVIKEKFQKEISAIYKPFASIIEEDFTTVKYVSGIVRKQKNTETLIMTNYVEGIGKKSEKLKKQNFEDFNGLTKEENTSIVNIKDEKIEPVKNSAPTEIEKNDQHYDFNMILPEEVVKEDRDEIKDFYQMQNQEVENNIQESQKNINSDIPDFINMEDLFPSSEDLQGDNDSIKEDLVSNETIVNSDVNFDKDVIVDPIIKSINNKRFNSNYLNFKINYENIFLNKISENKNISEHNSYDKVEPDYISKFLRLDEYGIKDKSIERKQKRKVNTSIMDEVYSTRTGKVKESKPIVEDNNNNIAEEDQSFKDIINDIFKTLDK